MNSPDKVYGGWFDEQIQKRIAGEKGVRTESIRRAYLLSDTSFRQYWVHGYIVTGEDGKIHGYTRRTDGKVQRTPIQIPDGRKLA